MMDDLDREDALLAKREGTRWHFTPFLSDEDAEALDLDRILGEQGWD